jgi:hypothetical protein
MSPTSSMSPRADAAGAFKYSGEVAAPPTVGRKPAARSRKSQGPDFDGARTSGDGIMKPANSFHNMVSFMGALKSQNFPGLSPEEAGRAGSSPNVVAPGRTSATPDSDMSGGAGSAPGLVACGRGRPGKASRAAAALAAAFLAFFFLGACQSVGSRRSDPARDEALRILGEASVRVVAERLEDPSYPGGAGASGKRRKADVLSLPYELSGTFAGEAGAAALGLSEAMGYGLVVNGRTAGKIQVVLRPAPAGKKTIGDLLREINNQLGKENARLGVDLINRRLVLTSSVKGGD